MRRYDTDYKVQTVKLAKEGVNKKVCEELGYFWRKDIYLKDL